MGRIFLALIFGLVLTGWSPAKADVQRSNSVGAKPQFQERSQTLSVQGPDPTEQSDMGCEKGQDRRQSDLCAQWKAADAAYDSAVWTARTYQLGIAGLAVGFLTLLAAAAAAWFARKAAVHARQGVESNRAWMAWAGSNISREAGSINGVPLANGLKIECVFTNRGQTPARIRSSGYDYRLVPAEDTDFDAFDGTALTPGDAAYVIPQGNSISLYIVLDDEESARLVSREWAVIFYTSVEYLDIHAIGDDTLDMRRTENCLRVKHLGFRVKADKTVEEVVDRKQVTSQNQMT